MTDQNAQEFLDAGASHVIVTSFVFRDGRICYENLEKISREVGKDRLVLDLSWPQERRRLLYRDRPVAEIYGCAALQGGIGRALSVLR